MNTSVKFKDYNIIQKIGYILLIIASTMILATMFDILNASNFVAEDLPGYIFFIGGILVLLPFVTKRFNGKNASKKTTIFLLILGTSFGAIAQDYSKQINAFEQSFSEKSVIPLNEYVSPKLKFDPIPVANTPTILTNIVRNLPNLNSMTILESSEGKTKVKYDFVGLGVRESHIYFDVEGKIIRIELIENLIKQEMEAQKKMKESVQLPSPGTLGEKYRPEKVELKATDGLAINGNLYHIGKDKPVVLLSHQAGYNRVEYADIAPKLNEMGYNCLAVDLRSGGNFAGKPNITAERAKKVGVKNQMVDARQDIQAAIEFLSKKYNQKVIVWGSSYSSSLALLEGVSNDKVKAIIAFSPGDYFGNSAPSLSTAFEKADKPFLVTSSKEESEALAKLIGNVKLTEKQSQFIPESEGFHGSRVLWTGQKGAEEYWDAVLQFLNNID